MRECVSVSVSVSETCCKRATAKASFGFRALESGESARWSASHVLRFGCGLQRCRLRAAELHAIGDWRVCALERLPFGLCRDFGLKFRRLGSRVWGSGFRV